MTDPQPHLDDEPLLVADQRAVSHAPVRARPRPSLSGEIWVPRCRAEDVGCFGDHVARVQVQRFLALEEQVFMIALKREQQQ